MLCVGGGVLLATVFVHMIPEVRESLETARKLGMKPLKPLKPLMIGIKPLKMFKNRGVLLATVFQKYGKVWKLLGN